MTKTYYKISPQAGSVSETNNNPEEKEGNGKQLKPDYFLYKLTQIIGIVLFGVSILVGIHYMIQNTVDEKENLCILFVVSILLVSVVYWENFLIFSSTESKEATTNQYTNEDTSTNPESSKEPNTNPDPSRNTNINQETPNSSRPKLSWKQFLVKYINSRREKVSILTAIWKVILTIGFPYLIFTARSIDEPLKVAEAISFLGRAKIKTLTGEVVLESQGYSSFGCQRNDIVLLIVIGIILGFISFKSARFACRVCLQTWCFTIPLTLSLLSTPLVFIPIMKFPLFWTIQECSIVQPLWELKFNDFGTIWQVFLVEILGFFSCVLLTLYTWTNNGSKLLKYDRLVFFSLTFKHKILGFIKFHVDSLFLYKSVYYLTFLMY